MSGGSGNDIANFFLYGPRRIYEEEGGGDLEFLDLRRKELGGIWELF